MQPDDYADDIDAIIEIFETVTQLTLTPEQRAIATAEITMEIASVVRFARIDTKSPEGQAALLECIERMNEELKSLKRRRF